MLVLDSLLTHVENAMNAKVAMIIHAMFLMVLHSINILEDGHLIMLEKKCTLI